MLVYCQCKALGSALPYTPTLWTEPVQNKPGDWTKQYIEHVRDSLDCLKNRRELVVGLQHGHRLATVCHPANISLLTGQKIRWDAEREQIIDDEKAAAMLVGPYRKPCDAHLRALEVGHEPS